MQSLCLRKKNPEGKSGLKKNIHASKNFHTSSLRLFLLVRPLHGAILNTLKCVLPTSFRVALVCNFPALGSLYASRVDFETVRNLTCVVAVVL